MNRNILNRIKQPCHVVACNGGRIYQRSIDGQPLSNRECHACDGRGYLSLRLNRGKADG